MQDRSFESFEKLPIARTVMRNALPAMAAMIMVLVYNLADTFFIGKTGDALLVAAVSLATPVFLLFMAAGTVFGIGGTSVISRALGEGRRDYARKVCSFCMWGSVLLGVLLSAFIIFFMEEILVFIGTSAATRESAGTYLLIVSLAGPLVLISTCFSNVVRAEGEATRSVLGQIMGNLINIVLDPILILGFGWGISGAAIATVIGYLASAIYYIFYYLGGKSSLGIGIRDFSIGERIPGNVFSIGIPAALGSVLMSLSQIIVNSRMSFYGDMAVAGMGVAMKVVIITGMICMGMGQGVQPVLGYSVGAGLWERFNKLLRFSLLLALVLGLVMTLFCYLFVEDIVSAFLTDQDAFSYAVDFSRILLSTSTLFGVFYVLSNTLQAMGASVSSLVINLSRQGLVFIPALFLLEAALGISGIVWAQPVADTVSLILAGLLFLKSYKLATRSCS